MLAHLSLVLLIFLDPRYPCTHRGSLMEYQGDVWKFKKVGHKSENSSMIVDHKIGEQRKQVRRGGELFIKATGNEAVITSNL